MPRMDGTGPDGKGPIGRNCPYGTNGANGAKNAQDADFTAETIDNSNAGFGFRRAGRGGMGRRFGGRRRP